MKCTWRPSLTAKEAIAICGPLSKPGKMPGHGYALPAQGYALTCGNSKNSPLPSSYACLEKLLLSRCFSYDTVQARSGSVSGILRTFRQGFRRR
jgi:hypothetical protein